MMLDEDKEESLNIIFLRGDVLDFKGDAIICPCCTELTFIDRSELLKSISKMVGNDLLKELCAIGYCNIGNVIITKGYNLQVKNIIHVPYIDRSETEVITFTELHEAIRNAFDLAILYELKKIAIVPFPLKPDETPVKNNQKKWLSWIGYQRHNLELSSKESVDIITGLFNGYKNQIEQLTVYVDGEL